MGWNFQHMAGQKQGPFAQFATGGRDCRVLSERRPNVVGVSSFCRPFVVIMSFQSHHFLAPNKTQPIDFAEFIFHSAAKMSSFLIISGFRSPLAPGFSALAGRDRR
ncbi:MAG: hypothetical protein ISR51_05565 [Rhodospirillales bacterium]|nr:hypothetical protein [Rhodospirillales bacterium]